MSRYEFKINNGGQRVLVSPQGRSVFRESTYEKTMEAGMLAELNALHDAKNEVTVASKVIIETLRAELSAATHEVAHLDKHGADLIEKWLQVTEEIKCLRHLRDGFDPKEKMPADYALVLVGVVNSAGESLLNIGLHRGIARNPADAWKFIAPQNAGAVCRWWPLPGKAAK